MSWKHYRRPTWDEESESYEEYEARCDAYDEEEERRAEEYIERRYEREYPDL